MQRMLYVLLALALTSPGIAFADMAQEVIQKNLEARGGIERIKAVESLRAQCIVAMGGSEAPCVFEWKRPNKVRMEFTVNGQKAIQAFDGETGWAHIPFMGRPTPTAVSPEENRAMKETSYYWGPLLDWEERGYLVAYSGQEDVDGVNCHKLMVTSPAGDITYLYIDDVYHLQVKEVQYREAQGQDVYVTLTIGDYREIDGVFIPFAVKQKIKSTVVESGITFEDVELNVEIADDRFTLPTSSKPSGTESAAAGSQK